MTISDPVFAFQSVRSLVLAECVEVTFTVQKEDLPYVCFGQIYVQTLLFVCELIGCQAHVYLDKHAHTKHTCTIHLPSLILIQMEATESIESYSCLKFGFTH